MYVNYTTEFPLGGPNSGVVRMLAFSVTECQTWKLNLCPLDLTLLTFLDENCAVVGNCAPSCGRCVITVSARFSSASRRKPAIAHKFSDV